MCYYCTLERDVATSPSHFTARFRVLCVVGYQIQNLWRISRSEKISENLSDLDNAYKGLHYNPRKSSPQFLVQER